MKQALAQIALVVRDYDEAIAFYTNSDKFRRNLSEFEGVGTATDSVMD